MPYYRHEKDSAPETGEDFDTRQGAMANWDKANERITFVPTSDEKRAWRQREQRRFEDGTYVEVPWTTHIYPDHYVHLSVKAPGLIAYTASEEKGRDDKQTQMRPGKYLEQFYSQQAISERCAAMGWSDDYKDSFFNSFCPERIAEYIAQCQSEFVQLQFAATPDEIEQVYLHGPESCMAHPATHFSSSVHPVRVYGNSDLQVAYLGDSKKFVSARAVVWPEKKICGSTYGSVQVLEQLLANAGYKNGSFYGARIRAIPEDGGGYVMPYLDVADSVSLERGWFVLGKGDHDVKGTNGLLEQRSMCEREDCDNYAEDGGSYCYNCRSEMWTCHTCGEENFGDDGRYKLYIRGYLGNPRMIYACESCRDAGSRDCRCCDESYVEAEYSWSVQQQRLADGTDVICVACDEAEAKKCDHCYGWHTPKDEPCAERLAYEEKADELAEDKMAWEGAAL
jgi:hypothetical protein